MASLVFMAYALSHAALFVWALGLFLRYRHPVTVPLLLVTAGLVYDNATLGLGRHIGHGPVLEVLSIPRFFMHAVVTPMLILAVLGLVRRIGPEWTRKASLSALAAVLVLAMIAVGYVTDMVELRLVAKEAAGVVSYTNAGTVGPPIPALVVVAVVIGAGAIIWRTVGWPWLLAGAVAQLVLASFGDALVVAGNMGELAFLGGLVATDWRLGPRLRSRTREQAHSKPAREH